MQYLELKQKLDEANRLYRLGEDSGLTDQEYDFLLEQVNDARFKEKVGYTVEKNKVNLPLSMGSLNKVKSKEELSSWIKRKNIKLKELLCVTPKYDGLSLLVEFNNGKYIKAYTRGDGVEGQDVTNHFQVNSISDIQFSNFTGLVIGECIMKDHIFNLKYKDKFKNSRNMVAGLLARKTLNKELSDVCFVAYGMPNSDLSKVDQVSLCNKYINSLWNYKVPYISTEMDKISENELTNLFESEKTFQCDGLVIEVNNKEIFDNLGKETNSLNPVGARAWKPESQDTKQSKVINVTYQVTKSGAVKPVINITPIDLGGVTISNVTGINAKYIKESKINKESVVSVIRAGDVIPKVVSIPLPSEKGLIPENCPCCNSKLEWNESNVDLMCNNDTCEDKVKTQNLDFFNILNCKEIGMGTINSLYDEGFKSVHDILNITLDQLLNIEGFKQKKSEKVLQSIRNSVKDITLEQLQHASNLFSGLGERKLKLLSKYNNSKISPKLEDIIKINGFSKKSANYFLDGYYKFWEFESKINNITYKSEDKIKSIDDSLNGKVFVFTGVRSKDLESVIKSKSGIIGSSVNSKTSYLIVKSKESNSSKMKKAKDLKIPILDLDELKNLLI